MHDSAEPALPSDFDREIAAALAAEEAHTLGNPLPECTCPRCTPAEWTWLVKDGEVFIPPNSEQPDQPAQPDSGPAAPPAAAAAEATADPEGPPGRQDSSKALNMNMDAMEVEDEPPPHDCEVCGVGGDVQHVACCDICATPRCQMHRVGCGVCAGDMSAEDWGEFFCMDCHRIHMATKHGVQYDGLPCGFEGLSCAFEWMLTQAPTRRILLCMLPGEVRALKAADFNFYIWVMDSTRDPSTC